MAGSWELSFEIYTLNQWEPNEATQSLAEHFFLRSQISELDLFFDHLCYLVYFGLKYKEEENIEYRQQSEIETNFTMSHWFDVCKTLNF